MYYSCSFVRGTDHEVGRLWNIKKSIIVNMFDSEVYFFNLIHTLIYFALIYNELSQKTSFQSAPIATLCVYNIQREKSVFKKISLYLMYVCTYILWCRYVCTQPLKRNSLSPFNEYISSKLWDRSKSLLLKVANREAIKISC